MEKRNTSINMTQRYSVSIKWNKKQKYIYLYIKNVRYNQEWYILVYLEIIQVSKLFIIKSILH